jgi:pyruvate,water dikinase
MTTLPAPTPIPLPPDFPVEWRAPQEQMLQWEWDQSHFPHPMTPLIVDLMEGAAAAGFAKGLRDLGAPIQAMVARRINTFLYYAFIPDLELLEGVEARVQRSVRERGFTAFQRWNEDLLPEVEAASRYLLAYDYAAASRAQLAELIEWLKGTVARMWEIHFSLLPGFYLAPVFKEACARLLGLTGLEAYEMMQGEPNLSVESGSKLWQLAQRAPLTVKQAIAELPADEALARLTESAEGRAFLTDLNAFLQVYGWRSGNFDLLDPAWTQEPRLAIDQLRLMLRVPVDPAEDARRGAERAEALANECRAKLAGDPAKLGEFNFLLAAARTYPQLQENHHFYLDQKAFALSRLPFLEVGRRMVAAGLLDTAPDIPYLHLDEITGFLGGDLTPRQMVVAERKAEMARWRCYVPPKYIGSAPPVENDDPFFRDFFGAPGEPSTDPSLVRGMAASRGTVTGTARVIRSLAESDRIQDGDILVCDMTTPAWTPLFASLGGIVADAGGPLSHCAVVAREYGIPCVTGTATGTRAIPDGATITVDGAQGIVRIVR